MATDTETVGVKPVEITDVDFEDDEQVTHALSLAIADALRYHKENGQYVVAWRDGKVVRVEPEDIVVPEVE